jgi:hypothetical protein
MKGGRLSGDWNTGLGNSLLNEEMFEAVLDQWCIEVFELLLDGDDSVIIIEEEDLHKVDMDVFKFYHMKTKLNIVKTFEEVEFCQCKPVNIYDDVWTMVRNPVRFIQHFTTQRNENGPEKWPIVAGYALCEFVANNGVPVLSVLCSQVYRKITAKQINYKHAGLTKQMLRPLQYEAKVLEITPTARASFELAWGITIPQQIAIEQALKNEIGLFMPDYTGHKEVKLKPDKATKSPPCLLSWIDLEYKEAPSSTLKTSEHVIKWRELLNAMAEKL